MKQFCTECGKPFYSANLVCPYCEFKNKPIPGQKTIEETVADAKEAAKPHPMTIAEYDEWQSWMILARMPFSIHEHLQSNRRHEEMMDELRRR